jgi:NADH:ubiquinone oxidoreductase subunit E
MSPAQSPSSAPALPQVLAWCRPQGREKVNVLSSLLVIQDALGAVPTEAIPDIAATLGVTEADVAGVLSYYPELRTAAPGRHVVRICAGESCKAHHCERLVRTATERLKVGVGGTTADGRFTLQRVYCLGSCAVGPTVLIDRDVHGSVTSDSLPALLDEYK